MNKRSLTLVELLLAIAILAMVMTMIYGMLLSTLKARDQISSYTQANRLGPTILSLITDDISAMYTYSFKKTFFAGKRTNFNESSELHFITSVDSKIPEREDGIQSDICEVGYYCRPNEDDSEFLNLYRREDFFVDEEVIKGGTGVLLSSKIQSFVIEYYNGDEWVDNWSNLKDKGLPEGIRVEIVLLVPSTELLEDESITFRTVIVLPPVKSLEETKEEEKAPR